MILCHQTANLSENKFVFHIEKYLGNYLCQASPACHTGFLLCDLDVRIALFIHAHLEAYVRWTNIYIYIYMFFYFTEPEKLHNMFIFNLRKIDNCNKSKNYVIVT